MEIKCPLCKAKIPSDALRCSHCAGDLNTKEIQEKIKEESKKQKKAIIAGAIVAVIFIIIIVLIAIASTGSNSTPSTTKQKLGIGEEGIINFREDKNDCSGEDKVLLGITKEAQDKVSKALLAKDYIGMGDLLLSGEAFAVNICTKAKVIDTALYIRQVRILEGKNFGRSGWLPYEWIK